MFQDKFVRSEIFSFFVRQQHKLFLCHWKERRIWTLTIWSTAATIPVPAAGNTGVECGVRRVDFGAVLSLRGSFLQKPPAMLRTWEAMAGAIKTIQRFLRAIPHNSARADFEKNWVLMKAVFRRNTLCISRKSDKIRAQFFRKMPKTDYAVFP